MRRRILLLSIVSLFCLVLFSCNKKEETKKDVTQPEVTQLADDVTEKAETKTYEAVVHIGEKSFTYDSLTTISIDTVEKLDNYQYLGLYLDEELTQAFEGTLTGDVVLYMDYNIIYNVSVDVNGEKQELLIKKGEKIDLSALIIPDNYVYYGLFSDSSFNTEFDLPVENDIALFAKLVRLYNVNLYIDGKLVSTTQLEENETYSGSYLEYNPRYQDVTLRNMDTNEEYDKTIVVQGDLNLYLDYVLNNENTDVAIIRIHSGNNVTRIEKEIGSYLSFYDVVYASFYNSLGYGLFTDSKFTNPYNYGLITGDLDLYFKVDEDAVDYAGKDHVEVKEVYVLASDKTRINVLSKYVLKGEVFKASDFDLAINYLVDGIYLDSELTIPYEDQALSESIMLYAKCYEEVQEGQNAHKVTIYYGSKMSEGISNIDKSVAREFYVMDGAYIPDQSFKDRTSNDNSLLLAIYYLDTNQPYLFEPIHEDVEFFYLNDGVTYGDIPEAFVIKELVIDGVPFQIKVNAYEKVNLTAFDFGGLYELYLDSDYNNPYEGGFDFDTLYLKSIN